MTKYSDEAQAVVTAMDTRFEKLSNKKNTLDADYSSDNNSYPTCKAVNTAIAGISGGTVAIREKSTPNTGYLKTYVLSQNNIDLTPEIDIPKDFLLKSGEVKTCTVKDQPISGLNVGDKYLDLVINVKSGTATDDHVYIPIKDLTSVYTADNVTLELSNAGVFSIKAGGVGTTQLASGVVTSLGYADDYHSSPASGITSSNISSWNAKSDITTNDVDTEIEAYFDALITALTPSS